MMEPGYKLQDIDEEIPKNYRLLTVEEVLNNANNITKFLVDHSNGIERDKLTDEDKNGKGISSFNREHVEIKDELTDGDDGYKSRNMEEIFSLNGENVEIKGEKNDGLEGKNTTTKCDKKLVEFLVYKEYGDDSCAGFARVHWNQDCQNDVLSYGIGSQNTCTFNNGEIKIYFEEVELFDEDYDDDTPRALSRKGALSRSSIDNDIREGYHLASLEELERICSNIERHFLTKKKYVKNIQNEGKDIWLMLRKNGLLQSGKDKDIQDFGGTYFSFEGKPKYEHSKIRLKNGFIDVCRRLVWKKFTKHYIDQILTVSCKDNEDKAKLEVDGKVVALLFACFLESTEEVEDIIKVDPDYYNIMTKNDSSAPSGGSAIHLCAAQGYVECLKVLFARLTHAEKETACIARAAGPHGETPLLLAVLGNNANTVGMLCTDRSINSKTKKSRSTPLMIATKYNMQKKSLWKPLVECKGLKLNEVDKMGNNVFHRFARYISPSFTEESHAILLKTLLEKCGCRVSYKAYRAAGREKLNVSVIKDIAKLHRENSEHTLKSENESYAINQPDKRMLTPLHVCLNVQTFSTESAMDDHDDDDDLNSDNEDEYANTFQLPPYEPVPIQFSRLLISAGADITATCMKGQNALHRVCELPNDYGLIQIIFRCFIDAESENDAEARSKWSKYVCSQDFYGQTPLHLAARGGHAGIVEVLLNPLYNDAVCELAAIRDFNDHTSLHYVATPPRQLISCQNGKIEQQKIDIAQQICVALSEEMLPLTTWSVGQGVGLADELAQDNHYSSLAIFLRKKRGIFKGNLLGLALKFENMDMTLELINRNAIITKDMKRHAQKGKLLKKEQEYLKSKIGNHNDKDNVNNDVGICQELKKKVQYQFYESRKKEVDLKIKAWDLQSKEHPDFSQIEELEKIKLSHQGRTTDQPTDEDLLDRNDIKGSISALLLNQHMGSPITLGILGGTGMGKSSMMLQVEHDLLSKAAKETLASALQKNYRRPHSRNMFIGAKRKSSKSRRYAKKVLSELQQVIQAIEYNKKDGEFDKEATNLKTLDDRARDKESKWYKWNSALKFIIIPFKKIKSMIFSILECEVLLNETMEEKIESYISDFNEENKWLVKRLALASDGEEVPALMTVRFDAWQYENRDEAWAGLAIEVLKEMESSMTKAQLLYASVMYSMRKDPSYARMNLIFPIIAYLILGGIVGLISYILLSIPNTPYSKSLKYGSVLVSAFLSIWKVLSKVLTYAKPISDKLKESTQSLQTQHLSKAGYQHQVMDDINFLRDRMTFRDIPMWHLWQLGAFILNISSSSTFLASPVEASDALKHVPLRECFRIIVFIDNLDRQKMNLFTPLNIILKSCNINAVVAMDKESIGGVFVEGQTADGEEDEAKLDQKWEEDKANDQKTTSAKRDTILRQLIQIPIILPEPDVFELNNFFLKKHLKDTAKQHKRHLKDMGKQHQLRAAKAIQSDSQAESSSSQPCIDIREAPASFTVLSRADHMTSEISIETEHPCLHQVTSLVGNMPTTNDSLQIEQILRHPTHPMQEISIETEHPFLHQVTSLVGKMPTTNDSFQIEQTIRHPTQPMKEKKKEKSTTERHESAWSEMKLNVLDSNYSRGEIEVFKHLSKHTYGYYRSPRAWKSLLNYHRLIRSLLSYDEKMSAFKAWRPQLVIWVFLCWQWKDQMNAIFENWEKLSYFDLQELEHDTILVDIQDQPKLKKVLNHDYQLQMLKVKRYERMWDHINFVYPTLLRMVNKFAKKMKSSGGASAEKQAEEGSSMKRNLSMKGEDEDEDENADQTQAAADTDPWPRLSQALKFGRYDLNMQSMQLFQKYRFDCKPGFLKLCVRK